MRAGVPIFVVALFAAVHAGTGCSNGKEGHEKFASADCTTPPCGKPGAVVGGPSTGAGGSSAADAAADAASRTGLACVTDPTSQITLCAATTLCPDFRLDTVSFPGCGFIESSGAIDLECVCNGTQLCPIGVQTSCTSLPGLIARRTVADICNQVVNGTCRNLGGVPASGMGGSSSSCDRACAATCPPNSLACLTSCGC